MAKTTKEQLENYLNSLPEVLGKHNTKLIQEHAEKYEALPYKKSEGISYSRIKTVCIRLKTISLLLNNKPLDSLTEKDLQNLNTRMRAKGMESASDYRKVLKKYLRLKDRKKYIDLLESEFIKSGGNSVESPDPETNWSQLELDKYIAEAKKHGIKYAAFIGLMIGAGLRPHEDLALSKGDVVWQK